MNGKPCAFDMLAKNINDEIRRFYQSCLSPKGDMWTYERFAAMLTGNYGAEHLSDNEVEWLIRKINPLAFLVNAWLASKPQDYSYFTMMCWIHDLYEEENDM